VEDNLNGETTMKERLLRAFVAVFASASLASALFFSASSDMARAAYNTPATPTSSAVCAVLNLLGDVTSTNSCTTTLATTQSAAHTWSGNQTISGTFTTSGAQIGTFRNITAAGAITVSATTDEFICVNKTTGAATTVNLPASPATGLTYVIKDCKGDAATNNITVTPAAGNIDGASTFVMATNHQSANVLYDGTQWEIW
jgi:hypothetical protein